jgi:hypothetical protein
VCIVCCDGLKGLPEAIAATWPLATIQTCVVHLVRNSLRYASKADWSRITTGLKAIYTAATVAAAEASFAEFARTWRGKYPALVAMWERSWAEFVPFLDFPPEIRTLVYTTNGIESLNSRFRQAVHRRGHRRARVRTEPAPRTLRDRCRRTLQPSTRCCLQRTGQGDLTARSSDQPAWHAPRSSKATDPSSEGEENSGYGGSRSHWVTPSVAGP